MTTNRNRQKYTRRKIRRAPASRQAHRHYTELRAGLLDTRRDIDPAEYARECRRLARLAGV